MKLSLFCLLTSIMLVTPVTAMSQASSNNLYLMFAQEQAGTFLAEISTDLNEKVEIKTRLISTEIIVGQWSSQTNAFLSANSEGYTIRHKNDKSAQVFLKYPPTTSLISYMDLTQSPDGQNFVFIKEQLYSDHSVEYSLDLVLVDGTQRPIFKPEKTLASYSFFIESVRWSPDGAYIAFNGKPFGELNEGNIYLLSSMCLTENTPQCSVEILKIKDQSGVRLLGRSIWEEDWNFPTWSPDSKRLAFRCGEQICILRRDGTNFLRIPVNVGANLEWSPDGQFLAYMFNNDIYLLSLNTYRATRLTNNTDYDNHILSLTWLTLPDADFLLQ
jgi:dipeptidyl aminopeptidase/acylaminoacyl peptidase